MSKLSKRDEVIDTKKAGSNSKNKTYNFLRRKTKTNYLKDKINEIETNIKSNNIRNFMKT